MGQVERVRRKGVLDAIVEARGWGTWLFRGGGGRIRSLSKLKNTPKALISGQKSTLILVKTLTFSTK